MTQEVGTNEEGVTKVTLDWDTLSAIAEYYEFPVATFLQSKEFWGEMKGKTRLKELRAKADKYDGIMEIVEGDEPSEAIVPETKIKLAEVKGCEFLFRTESQERDKWHPRQPHPDEILKLNITASHVAYPVLVFELVGAIE